MTLTTLESIIDRLILRQALNKNVNACVDGDRTLKIKSTNRHSLIKIISILLGLGLVSGIWHGAH